MGKTGAIGIIPARFASTRFPGKPLAIIAGRPMLHWVFDAVSRSRLLEQVLVATDDDRIESCCLDAGIPVFRSRAEHSSGTDRVIEAFREMEGRICVNIQGDEPLIDPDDIDAAITPLLARESLSPLIVTLRRRIDRQEDLFNPNIVKVVCSQDGNALYFSRHPIPALFSGGIMSSNAASILSDGGVYYSHIGLYAYHHEFVERFDELRQSRLEEYEKLEQLRFLDNGFSIRCVEVENESIGVDRPADIARIETILRQRGIIA